MNIKIILFIFILILTAAVTTSIYHKTQQADISYYHGHRFFEKGEYEKAIAFYQKTASLDPSNQKALKELAYSYQWTQKHPQAIETFNKLLAVNPQDQQIKRALAQTLSWNKQFEKATSLYEEILQAEESPEVKEEMADVLSWDKKYDQALELYDEVLDEEGREEDETQKVHLQKARVLGWARRYDESLKTYQSILDKDYDELIELEMKAKQAYWDNRVEQAISYSTELIEKDEKNVEAMFDLSQIYSYQAMWQEAIEVYEQILNISDNHFRAQEGLQKIKLIATHAALKTGYEFFEADSQDRSNDVKRHTFFNRIDVPLNYNNKISLDYKLTSRSFSDFTDVVENEARVAFSYLEAPEWWIGGFYGFIDYNKGIDTLHTFGADFNFRVFDSGVWTLSHQRERLENSSGVITSNYYRDNYKQRMDMDVSKRLKIGLDYLFSNYSDDNCKNEPGADILYYLSLEPKRLSMKYRYFFRDFDDTVTEYFSPRDFSTHKLSLNWRHFLNKEEVFFGADDLYYDLKYDMAVDSTDIVSHKFSIELNRDINKKLNFNLKGSFTNSSADVYEDKSVVTSVKYYF